MKYNPNKHHRKSIRLRHYDYSRAGAYFVTVVTQNRKHLFGQIENGIMKPNEAGIIVEMIWHELPDRFPHVSLDAFVVMPNHVHGIIVINDETPSNDSVINAQSQNKTPSNVIVGVGLVPTPAHANNKTPLDKTRQINDESGFTSNDTTGAPTRGAPTITQTSSIANDTDTIPQTLSIANENAQKSKRLPLGDVVGIFKSLTTHAYVMGVRENGWPPFDKRLWQRDYYEHIIRTDEALANIQAYIEANPQNWQKDTENTAKKSTRVKR
jgi:putative transposase